MSYYIDVFTILGTDNKYLFKIDELSFSLLFCIFLGGLRQYVTTLSTANHDFIRTHQKQFQDTKMSALLVCQCFSDR